jgi:hypothetical protein
LAAKVLGLLVLEAAKVLGLLVLGAAAAHLFVNAVRGSEIVRPPNIIWVANEAATGTTINKLAKLTGAPSTAIVTTAGDTGGAVGVCVSGCGVAAASARASIANWGNTSCVFDAAVVAGHYFGISGAVAGNCADAGAAYPAAGQVLGRVLATGGAGTYPVVLFGPDIQAAGGLPPLPAVPMWTKYALVKLAHGAGGCVNSAMTTVFTGPGVDDMTVGGACTNVPGTTYTIVVDALNTILVNALSAGGSDYYVGQTFTVDGGTTLAAGVVDTIGVAGTVATYTLTTRGAGYGLGAATTTTAVRTWTGAAATLVDIVVATDVGTATTSLPHGLVVGVNVPVSGATAATDVDLNGAWVVTGTPTPSSFTFNLGVGTVPDGTYIENPLTVTVTASGLVLDITTLNDTYTWRRNAEAWNPGIVMTIPPAGLVDGITVAFASITGHTLAEQWVITAVDAGCWQVNGVLGANAAAALTQDVTLGVVAARTHVSDYRIKVGVRCTGAATALTGLGTTGTNVLYRAVNYNIDQAVAATAIVNGPPTAGGADTHAATNVVASLVNTVNNIDQLIAGCAVDFWLLQGTLP